MEEIKVGEYVRTKEGVIAKVISKDGLFIDIDKVYFDECYQSMRRVTFDERITKHSPNIIDLIEVGDYVNGCEVIFDESMNKLAILRVNGSNIRHTAIEYFVAKNSNEQIKSIVTHEQFNSIKYEVI